MKEKFSLAGAFLFFPIFFGNALAVSPPCQSLIPVDNPIIAYKQRGNRCEGFYKARISVSLDLVSLLYGKLTFTPSTLHVISPKVRKQRILAQAVGIPLKTYYRLDALIEPDKSFEWPLNLVKKMKLRPEQIGLFGKLSDKKDMYVPLTVAESKAISPTSLDLNLKLRASTDVSIVKWRKNTMKGELCDLSENDWDSGDPITPTSAGRFYAGQLIELPPSSLSSEKSNFCIEFAAQTAETGKWLKRLLKIRITE
ncbi:MAG: hypothetical protein D3903_13005 [Candidatus Electrothrix sp. GM3_4]|nr:hypothetical protein [Candidatus Electrothrix sp. GM3_4]